MEQYIVIALAPANESPFEGCQIVPEDSEYAATHKQVFGPATKEGCDDWVRDNCGAGSVPQFIVAALSASLPGKYEGCLVVRGGDPIVATHTKVFGPASESECSTWVDENCGRATDPIPTDDGSDDGVAGEEVRIGEARVRNIENIENVQIQRRTFYDYLPHLITGLIILVVLAGTVFMLMKSDADFFGSADASVARGLITFLVAVVTIAIALILTISAVSSNSSDFKERFALGKEVLTILIGVLGTIIGFYFGSAPKAGDQTMPPAENARVAVQMVASNAKELETQGLNAMLAKNYENASFAFEQAYRLAGDYHNVDEINQLLKSQRGKFDAANEEGKNAVWHEIYCAIDLKYYWKISDDVRRQFREKLQAANYTCAAGQ